MKYYYPNMPNRVDPDTEYFYALCHSNEWYAEVKKNGWRCLVYKNGSITLWTRHRTLIKDELKQLRTELEQIIPDDSIIDGELLEKRTKDIKGKIYLFDVIRVAGKMVNDLPYLERKRILQGIIQETENIELARYQTESKRDLFYASIIDNEGIVLKKYNSKYIISETKCCINPFWIKVKKIEDHIKRG